MTNQVKKRKLEASEAPDLHIPVKLSDRFDFYPTALRERIDPASTDALKTPATAKTTRSHVVWIVTNSLRMAPEMPHRSFGSTIKGEYFDFNHKIIAAYESGEKANVAAMSQFITTTEKNYDSDSDKQYDHDEQFCYKQHLAKRGRRRLNFRE